MTVSIRYITLYVGGVPVQVVEGGSLHLIFAGLGATTVPGVPLPGARPDPFPYYVNEDELAAAGIGTSDASVAALVGDDASATSVALRAAFGSYRELAANVDSIIAGAITRDPDGAALAATVVWPDGTAGAYTADAVSTAFPGAVDAYHVTYDSPATRTYTQPTVTRDANGAVVNRPALVVS